MRELSHRMAQKLLLSHLWGAVPLDEGGYRMKTGQQTDIIWIQGTVLSITCDDGGCGHILLDDTSSLAFCELQKGFYYASSLVGMFFIFRYTPIGCLLL